MEELKDTNALSLNTPIEELEDRLMNEQDEDAVKDIIDLFNLNIQKKNIVRTAKLSELQDLISEQIGKRIEKNADAFNNKDLLDYFKAIQDTIDKSDLSPEIKIPVQINQQLNLNIDKEDELDRESKQRVIAAIQSILNKQNAIEVIDVEESESEEEKLESDTEFREE